MLPHITVNFTSTTRPRLNQPGHVNIGICRLVNGAYTWTPWQNNNRAANYPYHQMFQKGRVEFPQRKETPAEAGQREREEERQRQQQAAASGLAAGGSGAGSSSVQAPGRDGWNLDPWFSESGKRERWAENGQWTSSTR